MFLWRDYFVSSDQVPSFYTRIGLPIINFNP